MYPKLQSDDLSLYEKIYGVTNVSGSSVVCSSDFEIIEVHSLEDFSSNFMPLSSISFCLMIIFLVFYKKILDLIKHVIYKIINKGVF